MSDGGILDGDRNLLAMYWRYLADCIGLREWSFKLADDPPPVEPDGPDRTEAGAMIHFLYGRQYAILYIQDGWETWDPDELRQTLVHEAVHCHLHGMTLALNNVRNLIPAMAMDVVRGAYRDANEIATDNLSLILANGLPLPEDWLEFATAP